MSRCRLNYFEPYHRCGSLLSPLQPTADCSMALLLIVQSLPMPVHVNSTAFDMPIFSMQCWLHPVGCPNAGTSAASGDERSIFSRLVRLTAST